MSLLDFFQDYRRLLNAGEVQNPGLAIIFLQREYRLTGTSINYLITNSKSLKPMELCSQSQEDLYFSRYSNVSKYIG